jgi:cupin fold WbuC family metalloprotein
MIQIDSNAILELKELARTSARRRQHRNLHSDYSDPCQRLLNFLWHDSYIRPHRHSADPKPETLIALRGSMGCINFDAQGHVRSAILIEAGGECPAIIVEPGEWHTVVALSETALLLETKAGPFDQNAAKELAQWAAEEGCPSAPSYLEALRRVFIGGYPRIHR